MPGERRLNGSWVRGAMVLAVTTLAVGAVAITPAGSAVDGLSKREKKQGDKRWINVGEKATSADMATNAANLGGLPPSQYLQQSQISSDLDPRFVNAAELFTRQASCPGFAFYPLQSTSGYETSGALRFAEVSPDIFACGLSLPDGATVTSVRFTVFDTAVLDNVECLLRRMTSVVPSTMASVASSGTPATTEISTTAISNPVVDNDSFVYWAQCGSLDTTPTRGVAGASVTYTISGAGG